MKKVYSIRLSDELAQWVDQNSGGDRTGFITALLQAAKERRLLVMPVPAPFFVNDGSDPENPVLVCLNPR